MYFIVVDPTLCHETNFGQDIVIECIKLIKPRVLKKVDIMSWMSGTGWTRHIITRRPSLFHKIIEYLTSMYSSAVVVDIAIDHQAGILKIKGSHDKWWCVISVNASERLADPDSVYRIGKMIVKVINGSTNG